MDIEEIKCPLCSQIYNESDRMPMLLPDCGHSFCISCITECFELLKDHDFDDDDLLDNGDDLYSNDDLLNNDSKPDKVKEIFRCPEDE